MHAMCLMMRCLPFVSSNVTYKLHSKLSNYKKSDYIKWHLAKPLLFIYFKIMESFSVSIDPIPNQKYWTFPFSYGTNKSHNTWSYSNGFYDSLITNTDKAESVSWCQIHQFHTPQQLFLLYPTITIVKDPIERSGVMLFVPTIVCSVWKKT